jgi:hypothetical protein
MIATLRTSERARMLMYTAPLATDVVGFEFVLKACMENNIAPIAINQRAPAAVRTKKVILKIRSWFPEMETEPWVVATPARCSIREKKKLFCKTYSG